MSSSISDSEYVFQAEINQLMSLIINSFYSNREIFLRELISNASDALDKDRYNTLSNGKTINFEQKIQLIPSKNDNTLIIYDNGVGMSKDELISNLGTIARSGTKAFMENMKNNDNKESLIGQFGVGFYSAFLVADTVDVLTKKDNKCYKWSSNADGKFTIDEECDMNESFIQGTKIILHLKDDQKEYLDDNRLKTLVIKHNGFINYPIELFTTKTVSKEIDKEDEDEDGTVENINEKNPPPEKTTIEEIVEEFQRINCDKPIWTKKPESITKDEYASFYKTISNDWNEPLSVKHFSVEGQLEFKCILYIPKQAPFNMFENNNKKRDNIKLYVKKVFVTDDSESLSPEWMSFVKGVIDCEDLPLNISREFLQQNKIMKVIKKNIMKKVFEMIDELNDEDSKTFYSQFGKNIKLGICNDDSGDVTKLSNLLKFNHSNENTMISLTEYVDKMIEGQDMIYYYCGDDLSTMNKSFYLNKFKNANIDVLLMNETIDEYMVGRMSSFTCNNKCYKLQNITRDGLKLPGVNEFKDNPDMEQFCKDVKEFFGDRITKVKQINNSIYPCNIVSSEYGMSANMERIMKAQALQNNMMFSMGSNKVLELNVEHHIIKDMHSTYSIDNKLTNYNKNMLMMIYETSMIMSGYTLDDPTKYSENIFKILASQRERIFNIISYVNANDANDANDDEKSTMEEID